jgi:hypothetical protein
MDLRTRTARLINQAATLLGRSPGSLWTVFGCSRMSWYRYMKGSHRMPADIEGALELFVRLGEADVHSLMQWVDKRDRAVAFR